MPRKTKSEVKPLNAKDVPWGGYIDIRMDEEEKEAFYRVEREGAAELWLEYIETLGGGLKFGLSYDRTSDCYIATFTGFGFDLIGLEDRYCLSARAPEWQQATLLLVYKHVVLAERDWGAFKPKSGRMANFG